MERKQNHYLLFSGWIVLVFVWSIIFLGIETSYGFTLGKNYDASNWQEIDNIAPPCLVGWVKRGDFILKTGELNFDFELEKDFLVASQKNIGQFDVNEKGFIVDKKTGERPKFIYGLPFPNESLLDQKAGEKIMANYQFGLMRLGACIQTSSSIYIGKGGKEREITGVTRCIYYQGRPGGPIQNPDNCQLQWVYYCLSPMDIKGIVSLFWEYNDDRQCNYFIYTPMQRRMSRIPSTTRSDPSPGSDASMDDGNLWNGKNHSFNWKLIGETKILCGFSSPDKIMIEDLPDGTVKSVGTQLQFGFEIPNWKGAPWAPVNVIWSPRPVWIVEGVSKDPGYNCGRQLFYVDKDTFIVWFKEVYDRSGEYWRGLFIVQSFQVAPSGRNNLFHPDFYMGIDNKKQHATCQLQIDAVSGVNNILYCPELVVGPKDFTMVSAQQLTK